MSTYVIDETKKRKFNYFTLASSHKNLLGRNKDKDFLYKVKKII